MTSLCIVVDSYFDGTRHHAAGPFTIEIVDGRFERVSPGDGTSAIGARLGHPHGEAAPVIHIPFVMPGLVEAHCHLFLDGAELDFEARKKHLKAPRETMLDVGRKSLCENLNAGVTLVRDAGDLHGINTQLKADAAQSTGVQPKVLSAGRAIRKAGRYGSFMGVEVTDRDSIVRTIRELAPTADQLKVLLTGIIDFEQGQMKGGVQFDLSETKLIVRTARELGLRTFAHCSGVDGLSIAVEAGIDSIEHGFFMTREVLRVMADKRIAWVPTFSPVYFQFEHPGRSGWNAQTVSGLWTILERHFETVALASEMGVPVMPGSDAGSYGARHGAGLIDELLFHRRGGMPLENILESATSLPRRLWGCEPADIASGNYADLILLEGSPFSSAVHLSRVRAVVKGTEYFQCAELPAHGRELGEMRTPVLTLEP